MGFDEPITVPSDALLVWTLSAGVLTDVSTEFETATNTLTLHFNTPVRNDVVTVLVDYSVSDLAGNLLDGEVNAPSSPALPSGDGLEGGHAVLRFRVLAGDANRDGIVDTSDANLILQSIGKCTADEGYSVLADLNADGCVNSLDVATFTLNRGNALPTTDGTPPSVLQILGASEIGPSGNLDEIEVLFTDAISSTQLRATSSFVVDSSSQLVVPSSVVLSQDRRKATFVFIPPLVNCERYTVSVSNGLADDSGNLLLSPQTPTVFGVTPPAPTLDPYPTLTAVGTLILTGTAQAGASVEVFGLAGICGSPGQSFCLLSTGPAGQFSAPLTLAPNHVNHVFFTTISGCDGTRSHPQPASITYDTTPPTLFVDSPADGAQLAAATADVVGRLSDTLSGYVGMSVTVNGNPAQVNVGIGTDGTFVAHGISLLVGSPTTITVVAEDTLGNSAEKVIEVVRIDPTNVSTLAALSGEAQTAPVLTSLTQPVTVQVNQADASPFVNKIVTFEVTRSDGLLSSDGMVFDSRTLQVHTDDNGTARAFWRLGSDAGSGNNRVVARSLGVTGEAYFSASATPGQPVHINVGSNNNQIGEVGNPAALPLIVSVHDGRNGIPNVPVTFQVVSGSGAVNGANVATVSTDQAGHAEVPFRYGLVAGTSTIEATFPGNTGLPATFSMIGIERSDAVPTTFESAVLDNANRPVGGATCKLMIQGSLIDATQSDIDGRFIFTDIPTSGPALVSINGTTSTHVGGVESNDLFPFLAFETVIVPNAVNTLPMPVLLPPLNPANARVFDNTQDVELSVEGIEGLTMLIRAGSMTRADGSVPTPQDPAVVSLDQVHYDKIPMPMPDGAAPPYSGTLQPGGAIFDPPVEVTLPNMVGLAPGAVTSFMSFDHNTNRFEIVATAHVSEDGCCIVTDPGSGIGHAGWHGPLFRVLVGIVFGNGGEGDDDSTDPDADPEAEPAGTTSPPASPTDENPNGSPDGETDPVYLFSGEFHHSHEDFRIKGRGLDFIWERKYRSKIGPNTDQGHNWDFSYNIYLKQKGDDFELYDGNTRRDTYRQQTPTAWSRPGFFRELAQNPNGSYTLQFSDKSEWNFRPFVSGPAAGRIESIVDRNGNTLSFTYDGLGRLTTVTDTLNRNITISHYPNGRISAVTDFAGRSVVYEYYNGAEPGGNSGDLKSVRTPVVTGTPNANDFPSGKTTVYTYTTGFSDDRLNHDLLSITDGKGQTYLQNIYAHTIDAGDFRHTTDDDNVYFDRIVRQIWGNPSDIIDFTYYEGQYPVHNGATTTLSVVDGIPLTVPYDVGSQETIINDRVGNVSEYVFDKKNRILSSNAFTGRADPSTPTTEDANRPSNRLRPSDPIAYETLFAWNAENRLLRTYRPNGSVDENLYEFDLNPQVSSRKRGNLRVRTRLAFKPIACITCRVLWGTPFGEPIAINELFEYDTTFVDDGFNFVTKQTDGRGHVTRHEYDGNGNRLRTTHRISSIIEEWEYNAFGQVEAHVLPANDTGHRRRDEYTYHASGPQTGYLHQEIIDAGGLSLTTAYGYDAVGNITDKTDPKGRTTHFTVNQLDQVIREASRPVLFEGDIAVSYFRDIFYDANDNVVRMDVRNVNDLGQTKPNANFTTVFEYEILNNLTRKCEESGEFTGTIPGLTNLPTCSGLPTADFITTDYQYDKNRNRTRMRFGEAVEGRQPANTIHYEYDERNLLFREIRAQADADHSTTQYDYDRTRNLVRVHQGTENAPRITNHFVDRHDRRIATLDPMGNLTTFLYDDNHNLTRTIVRGEGDDIPGGEGNLDGCTNPGLNGTPFQLCAPPGATNVVLNDTTYVYDDMDRLTETRVSFFDTDTGTPIGDGQAVTTIQYSATSQVEAVIDDNGNQTNFTYDTANRRNVVTDAKNNTTTYGYDLNSNLTTITTLERSDLGGPNQSFTTTVDFDGIDRPISVTDNVGNVTQVHYDSRSNRTRVIDAKGNIVRNDYDGLSRLTASHRELRDTGDGSGTLVGTITTTQTWDDTSRLKSQADDNGNTTTYFYDPLNRLLTEQFADGTSNTHTYDVHNNRLTTTDANGSLVTNTHDLLDRVTNRSIVPGPGVSNDTTFELFNYDGLSRIIRAEDNDSIITRRYNSRSNVFQDNLNGQITTTYFDGVGNLTDCSYPGGRQITTTFDSLNRKKTIADQGGSIATYNYVGPRRVERKDLGNGTRCTYEYDGLTGVPNPPGDESMKQIIRTTHTKVAGGAVIDDRSYVWDKLGNKKQRKDLRPGGPQLTHDYAYDSAYRLTESVQTPPGGPSGTIDYTLDDVHNRTSVNGGPNPGTYTMSTATPEPADRQMNQYTSTSFDGRTYDKNGNLTAIDVTPLKHRASRFGGRPRPQRGSPECALVYDYRNQMVSFSDATTSTTATYAYDALGRRIAKVVTSGTPQTTRFFYAGLHVVEEQDESNTTLATYVYGRYLDEVLAMRRGGTDYYYHADDMRNVMALTNSSGDPIERYEYADYGKPSFFDGSGAAIPQSAVGNPYLFTGGRLDSESGYYHNRTRYFDVKAGRFTSQDTIGIWGDSTAHGNGYAYAASNPWTFRDSFGFGPDGSGGDAEGQGDDTYDEILAAWDEFWDGMAQAQDLVLDNMMSGAPGLAVDALGAIAETVNNSDWGQNYADYVQKNFKDYYLADAARARAEGDSFRAFADQIAVRFIDATVGDLFTAATTIGSIGAGQAAKTIVGRTPRTPGPTFTSPKSSPDFVVTPGGTAYQVPKNSTLVPVTNEAGHQTGMAYSRGTVTKSVKGGGTRDIPVELRMMDPTPKNPTGYVKYESIGPNGRQGLEHGTWRTAPHGKAHYPIDY